MILLSRWLDALRDEHPTRAGYNTSVWEWLDGLAVGQPTPVGWKGGGGSDGSKWLDALCGGCGGSEGSKWLYALCGAVGSG